MSLTEKDLFTEEEFDKIRQNKNPILKNLKGVMFHMAKESLLETAILVGNVHGWPQVYKREFKSPFYSVEYSYPDFSQKKGYFWQPTLVCPNRANSFRKSSNSLMTAEEAFTYMNLPK